MITTVTSEPGYERALADYVRDRTEEALYHASLLSRQFIEGGMGPDEIVALHFEALDRVLEGYQAREQLRAMSDAQHFLLEVMISYGVSYKDYLELVLAESIRDVATRTEAEQLRASAAEDANRRMDNVLAMTVHELRTPLTVVSGNLQVLQRLISAGQFERVPHLVEVARDALERLSDLTTQLSESVRGAPRTLALTPVHLASIVARTCGWAQPLAMSKGIVLKYEEEESRTQVLGNVDALLTVFGNLLSNAVRYTPSDGAVTVRKWVTGDRARVEVRDTGIGISPESQGRIFERFYRAPEAARLDVKGLGLGLHLVQQLVHAHDGHVEVESVLGRGTTFRVDLPTTKSEMWNEREADGG
ncbi:MAG: multi-sensor signal transduction histidine kinase [Chloroflexi bacterium]|nr:multi-sensor signal transduction histidine kinase [Chloroflexota bacterium]